MSRKIRGQIGYADNKDIPGLEHLPKGHYVYISRINNDTGLCDVNIITSLVDDKNNFDSKKLKYVKRGSTYSIPYYDSNFPKWSGVKLEIKKGVKLSSIREIGQKKIKSRHKWFIGKYSK